MHFVRRRRASFAAGAVWCIAVGACGADARYVVIGTARAPSASGIVEIDDIDGGNTLVTIHLEYLHPPNRLDRGYTTYVVWFQGEGGAPMRAGALSYDAEARTGDLSETSPMQKFVVKVTAERDANPSRPSEYVIATQEVAIE
jgi:hypothetical protein